MIVKGAARSGPQQLAVYLMRVARYDTGEPAELLELQSGWSETAGESREDTAGRLAESFRDWQFLVEGTRGRDGLYHAQISPEAHYARNMTPDQWKRCANILEEELGLKGQPRALVLHAEGEERPHLHVVWQRADVETMTLWDDGFNYVKHECASARMELEFGQDFVPGKHAKRDRKKQPEFPRAEMNRDEAQQAKRKGANLKQVKAQVVALRAASDSPLAFRAALEEAGFMLAKGDRGYALVDREGTHYNLARQLKVKTAAINAYMAPVPLDTLPTIEQAKEAQAARCAAETPAQAQQPEAAAPPAVSTPQTDAELEALETALAKRQAVEEQRWRDWHAHEVGQLEFSLTKLNAGKMADRDAADREELDTLRAAHKEQRTGWKGLLDAIQARWNPEQAAEKRLQQRREIDRLRRRQERERKDYEALIEQTKQLEIENLKERQARDRLRAEQQFQEEKDRYIREHHQAKRLLDEIQAQERELEHNDSLRDGPPPPKLGK